MYICFVVCVCVYVCMYVCAFPMARRANVCEPVQQNIDHLVAVWWRFHAAVSSA